jgi:MFS family permease
MLVSKARHCFALAFAGLFSGFLTCAGGRFQQLFGPLSDLLIGAIFGFVLIFYWWIFQGFRSFWRSAAFVLACTAAYFCAIYAGINAPPFLLLLSSFMPRQLAHEFEICFTGGVLGGAMVFLAAVLFLPNRAQWKHVPLNLVVFGLLSGLLGVVGWALGPYFGTGIWHLLQTTQLVQQYRSPQDQPSEGVNFNALFVVWQVGAAALLGLLLARPRPLLAGAALEDEPEILARW